MHSVNRSVGVVGAGVMGRGVALASAQAGFEVVLVDVSGERLADARLGIEEEARRHARFSRLFDGTAPSASIPKLLNRIHLTTDYAALARCELVVENTTENRASKENVHRLLDGHCDPKAVIAINTSAIPITQLAGIGSHPERVVGVHFMNPVHLMPMVEVIPAVQTDGTVLEDTKRFLAALGKECIVVKDSPGFVTNRVMMLTVNEAAFLVYEGVSSAQDVDRLFKTCFGHKMGPLETADLIGVDTILYSIEVLYHEFADSKYRPCPLLRQMVGAGRLGRKNGAGFYDYKIPD